MYHDSWINQYDEHFDTKKSNDSPVDIDACELLDPLPFPPEEPWPPWPDPKDPPDPAVVPELDLFKSKRSEITENGNLHNRPSLSKKAKCDGPTSIWEAVTEPDVPGMDGTNGPGLAANGSRSRSPTSRSRSVNCSLEPIN